jgi:predicted transcriptional regulator of viral defense system
MKKEILSAFNQIPFFTIEAVKQLYRGEPYSNDSVRKALYRWVKAGHVIQLKKGVYMTSHFYEQHRSDVDFSAAISAILIPQSYVSLEYVLQRHAILSEITYPVTAVTIKHARVIENTLGTFAYRNIKEDLYTGFEIFEYMGIPFSQASLSKALFDYLYLRPLPRTRLSADFDLAEELRLNIDDFSEQDQTRFSEFVEISKSKKMHKILKNFRSTVWRH